MRTVLIIQARMGSARLPGKVLKPIVGRSMIELILNRLSLCEEVDQIIVAASEERANDQLQTVVEGIGYGCTRGSEQDVLKRFYESAREAAADVVVRITADCPLADPGLIDQCIRAFQQSNVDYFSNVNPVTFPDGLDVEVMTMASLERANREAITGFDREHVTPYISRSEFFNQASLVNDNDLSDFRWSVDEPEDLVVINAIYEHFYPDIFFPWRSVIDLQLTQPEIFKANSHIMRNEGGAMGSGQKLYKRAKKIIPGGNMLLSKRPEMFLPDYWPAYFSKASGCNVLDLDDKKYIDMSIMGIGTNILGYGHPEVDEAVLKCVKDGNMSSLNCPEEVYLAEKLVELNPWADMVRFARAGGEINSIAIRIARAYTGKDKIAICGYHGWHDWYLSSNLNGKTELDGHLLPGLRPDGVPRGLTGTTLPFSYNKIEELENLIRDNKGEIAAIKMEVSRNSGPTDDYLQKVRDLATENKIILIFDECTSGFRETFGGLHIKYCVEPDIALFAKALGNGYAISACVGRRSVMEAAQKTFISSTFWTEKIGPSAALKTLEVMEREKSWRTITRTGGQISNRWKDLADKYELSIGTWGLPALCGFSFNSPDALAYKTYISQEMLKHGYLAGNCVYVSTAHTSLIVDGYFSKLDAIFETIKECEGGRDILTLLDGPICHSGFSRLN